MPARDDAPAEDEAAADDAAQTHDSGTDGDGASRRDEREPNDDPWSGDSRETPPGPTRDLDEAAVYRAVRRGVEDALLDVVGTLLLVGLALVAVHLGATVAFGANTTVGRVVGIGFVGGGVVLAAWALDVLPAER